MEKWKPRTDREIPTFPQPIDWDSDQKNAEEGIESTALEWSTFRAAYWSTFRAAPPHRAAEADARPAAVCTPLHTVAGCAEWDRRKCLIRQCSKHGQPPPRNDCYGNRLQTATARLSTAPRRAIGAIPQSRELDSRFNSNDQVVSSCCPATAPNAPAQRNSVMIAHRKNS
jgi:hypothetical protein